MPDQIPKYCTYCGSNLSLAKSLSSNGAREGLSETPLSSSGSITLVQGHQPEDEPVQFSLGPYQVLKEIAKGGMGEVYLAYDTSCGRRIALKRIRSDLMEHIQMHNRFLKEARITSQLTHPSIIPIYSIHGQNQLVYYTMPFVEGETLKQILRKSRQNEKKGGIDPAFGSIPALVRIFLSICQAIAYAHSKNVLHRDIKPENIIIGKYGEVLILDWGLAKLVRGGREGAEEFSKEISAEHEKHPLHQLTHIGKVVGTIAYMAPERAKGNPATVHSDIYSLGVILYQILTLRHPFKRGSLKQFRETMHLEVLLDPAEVAPYRDVPRILAQIAMKCLSTQVDLRYHSVDELIHDIENYIEGRAEWFLLAELDIKDKSHWEFQENVLIAEHIAITRGTELSDWVSLMISKSSFSENIRIEANVRLGEKGHGLGFLLSIPEAAERKHLNDGYCLWLGSDQNRSTKLLRSTVEVMHASDVFLLRNEWYHIRIEMIDNNIHLYINNTLQLSYISHLPLVGTHVGLLSRDADFTIKNFHVYVGSQNVMVNCLAVPDAFLAHKDFATALSEYRRIGYSFPGRAEGREAMFRAGITLLEQARNTNVPEEVSRLYDLALDEFEKLHDTPGAPLEYLGKALVYQEMQDFEEEVKCFELACRRYPRHPLLWILREQIVYRMHTSSRFHRKATYKFILLVVRHLPEVLVASNAKKLFNSLRKYWEPLPFIEEEQLPLSHDIENQHFAIILAFWLAKPYVLLEIIDEIISASKPSLIALGNALYCLIELGSVELAEKKIEEIEKSEIAFKQELRLPFQLLRIAIQSHMTHLEHAIQSLIECIQGKTDVAADRIILYVMGQALVQEKPASVHKIYEQLIAKGSIFSAQTSMYLDCARIWAYLDEKNFGKAAEILQSYPLEILNQDATLLHFLYGCWLYVTEGKEIASIHFSGILEITFPRTWVLGSHFFTEKIPSAGWLQKAFLWERRQLYKQLTLLYRCIGDDKNATKYRNLEKEEYL